MKKDKKNKPHYIDNKEFSRSVHEYVIEVAKSREENLEIPLVTSYIGDSFIRLANRLSSSPSFFGYTYKDEMVSDAIENCLRAIYNFDITKKTRTESPNAFAYFTQICYYAFLRRIAKEKKHEETRSNVINESSYSDFVSVIDGSMESVDNFKFQFIDEMRNKRSEYQS